MVSLQDFILIKMMENPGKLAEVTDKNFLLITIYSYNPFCNKGFKFNILYFKI